MCSVKTCVFSVLLFLMLYMLYELLHVFSILLDWCDLNWTQEYRCFDFRENPLVEIQTSRRNINEFLLVCSTFIVRYRLNSVWEIHIRVWCCREFMSLENNGPTITLLFSWAQRNYINACVMKTCDILKVKNAYLKENIIWFLDVYYVVWKVRSLYLFSSLLVWYLLYHIYTLTYMQYEYTYVRLACADWYKKWEF